MHTQSRHLSNRVDGLPYQFPCAAVTIFIPGFQSKKMVIKIRKAVFFLNTLFQKTDSISLSNSLL